MNKISKLECDGSQVHPISALPSIPTQYEPIEGYPANFQPAVAYGTVEQTAMENCEDATYVYSRNSHNDLKEFLKALWQYIIRSK